jgi:hypothetical protein
MRTRLILVASIIGVTVTACGGPKGGGGLRPDSSQFSSEWLEVSMGGMMSVPGEGPALTLSLKNKSRKPLWVEVEFNTPDVSQHCTVDKFLAVDGGGMFMCAQTALVQDRDYPVLVRTYSDTRKTKLLESTQTMFRFDAKDVAKFNSLVEAMQSAHKD